MAHTTAASKIYVILINAYGYDTKNGLTTSN